MTISVQIAVPAALFRLIAQKGVSVSPLASVVRPVRVGVHHVAVIFIARSLFVSLTPSAVLVSAYVGAHEKVFLFTLGFAVVNAGRKGSALVLARIAVTDGEPVLESQVPILVRVLPHVAHPAAQQVSCPLLVWEISCASHGRLGAAGALVGSVHTQSVDVPAPNGNDVKRTK
ncbi:hypothetical protein OA88_22715 [Flavobacterium sp. JRM]|nr:hypothetical protein OA88_22715 [Flavobacterium sp. JRM]